MSPALATAMPPPQRRQAALVLAIGVLVVHLWLLGQWAPGGSAGRHAGTVHAVPRLQLARRVQAVPSAALETRAAAVQGPAPTAAAPAAARAATEPTPAPPQSRIAALQLGVLPAQVEPGAAPPPAEAADASHDNDGDAAGADGFAPPEPPPVYPTVTPAPANWRYAMTVGVGPAARSGTASLSWQHDGQRYRLALVGDDRGQPLITQVSTGAFDAAGLAPERFVDQRRSRRQHSANFQRDSGRITFSGPRIEQPAWPGVQDRLGWIVQLAAIAQAAGGMPPEVTLLVVDTRGTADRWTFKPTGAEPISTGMGTTPTVKVLRESPRLQDWRVEAWLDPQRGYWPARLRMSLPRSGAVLDLALAADPGP